MELFPTKAFFFIEIKWIYNTISSRNKSGNIITFRNPSKSFLDQNQLASWSIDQKNQKIFSTQPYLFPRRQSKICFINVAAHSNAVLALLMLRVPSSHRRHHFCDGIVDRRKWRRLFHWKRSFLRRRIPLPNHQRCNPLLPHPPRPLAGPSRPLCSPWSEYHWDLCAVELSRGKQGERGT